MNLSKFLRYFNLFSSPHLLPLVQAFNVKPAIFDLILAICIALYLVTIYVFVSHFHVLKSTIQPSVYHSAMNGVNGKAGTPMRNGHAKKM